MLHGRFASDIVASLAIIGAAITRGACYGIIVKGGAAVEQVGEADAVVFDKTGTLTVGTPTVDRVVALDGYGSEEVLRLGAGLEQLSGHSMARALVRAASGHETAKPEGVGESEPRLPLPTGVTELAGQGGAGQVDGHVVDVGSVAFGAQRKLLGIEAVERVRVDAGAADETVAVVGIDGKATGLVVYVDPPRSNAHQLTQRLKPLGIHETAMLTGDDALTARTIASKVGINTVKAELLPPAKVAAVNDLLRRHRGVVMVGDGINDAPALATATVALAVRWTSCGAQNPSLRWPPPRRAVRFRASCPCSRPVRVSLPPGRTSSTCRRSSAW